MTIHRGFKNIETYQTINHIINDSMWLSGLQQTDMSPETLRVCVTGLSYEEGYEDVFEAIGDLSKVNWTEVAEAVNA